MDPILDTLLLSGYLLLSFVLQQLSFFYCKFLLLISYPEPFVLISHRYTVSISPWNPFRATCSPAPAKNNTPFFRGEHVSARKSVYAYELCLTDFAGASVKEREPLLFSRRRTAEKDGYRGRELFVRCAREARSWRKRRKRKKKRNELSHEKTDCSLEPTWLYDSLPLTRFSALLADVVQLYVAFPAKCH